MASSTLRKAIGVVKDQTSISIAKVAGNVAPDLEVLVVKATGHDNEPADEKYIRDILNLTSYSKGYVNACVYTISKRLTKTHDWIVALKALVLVHRLLVDGDPLFAQEIMYASRKGTRVLNMSDFRDEAHSSSWDHSGFVRTYAMYLDQKLEFIAFERKLSGMDDRRRNEDGYGDFRGESNYGMSRNSRSYGDLHESSNRGDKKEAKEATPMREMKPDRVLERTNQLLRLLDRFLSCRPTGSAKNSRMVLVALYLVVKESFRVYVDICEALGVLLDRFPDMEYADCVKGFDAYVNAAKMIDELVGMYNWCKDIGVARSSEFPEVQKITDKILGTLEGFLRDRMANRAKSPEKEGSVKANGSSSPNMNEIKALPPPENHTPPPPPPPPVTKPKPQANQVSEDLVNLKDETMSAEVQGNNLALALFSGPPTVKTDGSWEVFSEQEVTSAWQTPAAEIGKADWELALVETASNLSKQKADMAGGLDPLLLNGMYDQGAVRQHVSNSQLSGGSSSSVVLPGIGRSATPVLALPAPDGTIQNVGPHDPFEASLIVPPPSYVQIADMERKQHLLVQEQQLWQQYGNNGMQGQVAFAKISAGVAGYGGQPAGYYY